MAEATLRGRASELKDALSVVRHVQRTGRSAMVIVTGEPGIGKTAVLEALIEQARRMGFAVGAGQADEIDQISPGAPLVAALRNGPSPLADTVAFENLATLRDQPLWMIDRLGSILAEAATRAPIVVAIDDVHWADTLTRYALRQLMSQLARAPVVWALTSRLSPSGTLHELLGAARREVHAVRIDLSPLPFDSVMDIADEYLGDEPDLATRSLLQAAGGNPFWLFEILHGITRLANRGQPASDVSAGFNVSVGRRLQEVPAEVVTLAHILAVWGRPMPLETAGALLPELSVTRILDAQIEGVAHGLFVPGDRSVSFRHDLFREAVYADIAPAHRIALHRRCARHCAETDSAGLAAAWHFLASADADDDEAVATLQSAAQRCAASMPETAAQFALTAFKLLSVRHPRWLDAGEQALLVLAEAGHEAEALRLADRLGRASTDPATLARIQALACQALWSSEDASEIHRRTAPLMENGLLPDTLRTRLRALNVLAATRTTSSIGVQSAAVTLFDAGERLGDLQVQRLALLAQVEAARNEGFHQLALDRFDELRRFRQPTDIAVEVRTLQHLDRYDDAEVILDRHRRDGRNDGRTLAPAVIFAQMWQHHNLARFDEAEVTATTLLQVAESIGNVAFRVSASMVLAGVAIYRGHVDRARTLLSSVGDTGDADDLMRFSTLRLMRGWLLAEQGDPRSAVQILWPALKVARDSKDSWPWAPPWMRALAGIGLAAGDVDFAREASAIAALGASRNPGVASLEGVALQVSGFIEADPVRLRSAVDVLRRGPRPMLLCGALADLGNALLTEGHHDEAIPVLEEALTRYGQVGAHQYVRTVQDALRQAGVRPRRRTPQVRPASGWNALTEAETHVAELVAAGHTNRSAAAALGISANTVGTHLQSVFTKLEVRSRVQLANALRARD